MFSARSGMQLSVKRTNRARVWRDERLLGNTSHSSHPTVGTARWGARPDRFASAAHTRHPPQFAPVPPVIPKLAPAKYSGIETGNHEPAAELQVWSQAKAVLGAYH